jgi:hypothetical protein
VLRVVSWRPEDFPRHCDRRLCALDDGARSDRLDRASPVLLASGTRRYDEGLTQVVGVPVGAGGPIEATVAPYTRELGLRLEWVAHSDGTGEVP